MLESKPVKNPHELRLAHSSMNAALVQIEAGRCPQVLQRWMVEVAILRMLRAIYGTRNGAAVLTLAWRVFRNWLSGALFPVLHPLEARRIRREIAEEMEGM